MEPTKEFIDAIHREKVEDARRMKPEDKFLAGARLFDYACAITIAGIRHQFPHADEREIIRILRERLELARRREEVA